MDDWLQMSRYLLFNPPVEMIIISNVTEPTDEECQQLLAEIKAEDPDEYALLMEHLPIPYKWKPKENE